MEQIPREQMLKTLELNIAVQPTFASASIFQPYPGTTALEIASNTKLGIDTVNAIIAVLKERGDLLEKTKRTCTRSFCLTILDRTSCHYDPAGGETASTLFDLD